MVTWSSWVVVVWCVGVCRGRRDIPQKLYARSTDLLDGCSHRSERILPMLSFLVSLAQVGGDDAFKYAV